MSKVKVWGKEIDNCISCKYCSAYKPRCLFADLDLWEGGIHKDCPFSKPITDEIMESFGFKYQTNKFILKTYSGCINGTSWNIWLGDKFNNYITTIFKDPSEQLRFKGVINNPVELEFILKSIGVIE